MVRLIDSGMLPVVYAFIVELFDNWTIGPSWVFLMFVSINMSLVHQ